MPARILIVDDEAGIRLSLRGILEDEGHLVSEAPDGESGLEAVEREQPDLVFLDIWLPGLDGLAVLETLRARAPSSPAGFLDNGPQVIMISGHGNIETAVQAIKKGAFDFIEKPLSLEKVVIAANKALEFQALQRENLALRQTLQRGGAMRCSGGSPAMTELRAQIERVAPTDAWVLISGENGTGKEIVARSIHYQSRRKDKPLVAVNCAAIPEELIESELFGHEKGAFTGAESARTGKFELAHKGTLFLDEIGDMSLKTQAKILRILQEQCFERVGGRRTIRVDVRVIAASNKNLEEEIRAGNFREDLYYRLRVFPLEVPPLRRRAEDLALLIEEFTAAMVREHGFSPLRLRPDALELLMRYPWPGNVRELKNFVERMHILHAGQEVGAEQLPPEFRPQNGQATASASETATASNAPPADFKAARADFEARFLEARLRECNGSVAALAEAINMERSYLYRKLKMYGITPAE